MGIIKLSPKDLRAWVDGLIGKGRVVGIQKKTGIQGKECFEFADLTDSGNLRLDYDVALTPPKKFFLPPRDRLLKFEPGKYDVVDEAQPYILLGVHPYDVAAIRQMDKIFQFGHLDTHYARLREAATIVACDVQTPSKDVFAACMETATVRDGFDAMLTKVGEDYLLDIRTQKGELLAALLNGAPAADQQDLDARETVRAHTTQGLKKHALNVPVDQLPRIMADRKLMDHPVWAEKADLCYSCGSCLMVCPTCYCFDVQEDLNWDLKSGHRERIWDGCMLKHFARVSGDHNFRKEKTERYRHRYYRKGKWVFDRHGESGCVGCGRCIAACTTGIANPVEIFNRLAEVEQ